MTPQPNLPTWVFSLFFLTFLAGEFSSEDILNVIANAVSIESLLEPVFILQLLTV
jgi:hypothetical protein